MLEGETDIAVDGEVRHLAQGDAVFVAARAEHRFSGYDVVSLLVIFNGSTLRIEAGRADLVARYRTTTGVPTSTNR